MCSVSLHLAGKVPAYMWDVRKILEDGQLPNPTGQLIWHLIQSDSSPVEWTSTSLALGIKWLAAGGPTKPQLHFLHRVFLLAQIDFFCPDQHPIQYDSLCFHNLRWRNLLIAHTRGASLIAETLSLQQHGPELVMERIVVNPILESVKPMDFRDGRHATQPRRGVDYGPSSKEKTLLVIR